MRPIVFILIGLVLALALPARAEMTLDIKLNFFGPEAAGEAGPSVTTSFHVKSVVQRNLQVKFTPEAMLAELRRTFQAPTLALLASGDLRWSSAGSPTVMQVVQIDGRDYAVGLTPLPKPGAVNVKVAVVEKSAQGQVRDVLLDSEIVLPDGEVAILGFRDTRGRSFFIAFYVQGRDEPFAKGAVRLAGAARPKLLKRINPVYPKEALQEKLQGVVVLEGLIDEQGKVADVRVVSSAAPSLDQAAVAALRGWEYEPFRVDGKAKKVVFSVTINFSLDAGKQESKQGRGGPARPGDSRQPKLLKQIHPVYPPEAKKSGIQGTVVLEVRIDEQGRVRDLRVTSDSPAVLNQAALDAVRQWEYEPLRKDGKAEPLSFTVTVRFALN